MLTPYPSPPVPFPLLFTDPYGLPLWFESDQIHVSGLVVGDLSADFSHWSAASSLADWMAKHGVIGIGGVDTRALTKRIREKVRKEGG